MAAYRGNQPEEVLRWLGPLRGHSDRRAASLAGCFAAMAHQRLGQTNEARGVLDQANQRLDRYLQRGELGATVSEWSDTAAAILVRAEAETTLLGREVTPKPDAARLAAVRAAWTPVRAGLRPVEDLARTRQWRQAAEAFVKAMKEPGFDWPAVVSASEMAALEMAVAFLRAGDLEGHVKLSRIALAAARDSSSLPQVDRAAKGAVLSPRLPPDLVAEAARLVQSAESRSQEEYLAAWLKLARGMAEYRLGEYAQAIKSLSRVAASQENDAKPTALALRAMAAKRLAHDQEADQLLRQAESLRPAMARRLEANQANWPDLQIFDLVRDEARKLLGLPDQPK